MVNTAFCQVGQYRPAEPDACISKTLMLAIQRLMLKKLLDQQTHQKTYVDQTFIQHVGRCRTWQRLLAALALEN